MRRGIKRLINNIQSTVIRERERIRLADNGETLEDGSEGMKRILTLKKRIFLVFGKIVDQEC